MCSERNKTVSSSTQLAFSTKFPKNGRFRLPWSTIDLFNQRRRPNTTVAQREVKLRFWFLLLAVNFDYTRSRFFCKLHRDMNCMNGFAIHRCINEGYGLIQIYTEKIRISPTKLCLQDAIIGVTLVDITPPQYNYKASYSLMK